MYGSINYQGRVHYTGPISGKDLMFKKFSAICACLMLSGFASLACAAGGAEEEKSAAEALANAVPEIGYYDMTPDFTTSLAGSGVGRMHYLRVHVSIMVKDSNDLSLLSDHDPLIRDAILTIIGTKEYGAIATVSGRESLRAECRNKVSELMSEKKNAPVVQDLLFTNYVYQ